MPEVKNKFSVIMPVLNAREHLRASLGSILAAMDRYGNAECVVLDNGSSDGSYELLRNEYGHRVQVEQVPDVTVARLRNYGAQPADGEFLAFIDSDCRIVPDYFEQALEVLRSGVDVTGSKCALDESPHWIEEAWYEMHVQRQDGIVNYINSGNFVVRRRAFLQVNGFDESMVTCEDADICERLKHAGFRIYQAHAVRAVHPAGDKTLRVFFFKHAWRSMGMFGMLKNTWMSKPLLVTFAHLALCIVALANLVAGPESPFARFAYFVLLTNLAPAMSILYRAWQVTRAPSSPGKAMLLYHVYFLARFYAMWKLLLSCGASSEERNAIGLRLHG